MVDIVTVGAGGGSIAWLGPQDMLKVGPRSAGADPGPICYGRGGTEPTVTDANLVLGRIPPHLLGGEVALDLDAARAGVARVGDPLGLSVEEAAAGIIEIAVWNQTHGIRQVSVERGRDPSDFCLLAFGGSGGMVAAEVAELLGIGTVLVPERPGNASAFGLQVSDVKRDYVRTLVRSESRADPAEIDAAWAELERCGRGDLGAEGVAEADIALQRGVDARYVGEGHEVQVLVDGGPLDADGLLSLYEHFHDVHDRTFGYAYRGQQEVEIVNLRVEAVGRVSRPAPLAAEDNGAAREAESASARPVWFEGDFVECPIHAREALAPGMRFTGPAVVEEFGSTTVVRPDWRASVDPHRNLVMGRGGRWQ